MDESLSEYYLRDRRRVTGPFGYAQLKHLQNTRRLFRHQQVSLDGVNWQPIADVLPEMFGGGGNARGQRTPGGAEDYRGGGGDDISLRDPLISEDDGGVAQLGPTSSAQILGKYLPLVISAGVTVGALLIAAVQLWPSGLTGSKVGTESVVSINAMATEGGSIATGGVMASQRLCVVPLDVARYDFVKLRCNDASDPSEWHTAVLKSVDVLAGLAVVQVELSEKPSLVSLESELLLGQGMKIKLVSGEAGSEAMDGVVLNILNPGAANERFVVRFTGRGNAGLAQCLGWLVTDEAGENFVGMVTGIDHANGVLLCSFVSAIRNVWREARSLPADDIMKPISDGRGEQGAGIASDRSDGNGGLPVQASAESVDSPERGPESVDGGSRASEDETRVVDAAEAVGDMLPSQQDTPVSGQDEESKSKGSLLGNVAGTLNDVVGGVTDSQDMPESGQDEESNGSLLDEVASTVNDAVGDVTDSFTPDISDEEAKEIGDAHRDSLIEEHGICTDRRVDRRVRSLFKEIAETLADGEGDFTLTITKQNEPNAYAFIGRNVVVTQGFVDAAGDDDDMITFALAHEVGHEVLGHTKEPFRREKLAAGFLRLPAVVAETVLQKTVINKSDENDADCFAVSTVEELGRSREGGVRFFEWLMGREGALTTDDGVFSVFNSHPDHAARIARIRHGCK